jgi:uncharacterized damage-inducible protein DinB
MSDISPYLISPDRPNFTPNISRLVSMMNYARVTTIETVRGLTTEELDFIPEPYGNSIGMLLEHFAAVEVGYQGESYGQGWDVAVGERWKAGAELGELGREQIRGHTLRYYLDNLSMTRAATYAEFAKRDDVWLEEPLDFWESTGNRFFMWFHVLEDEINHRGQMRLIRQHFERFKNAGMMGLNCDAVTEEGMGLRIKALDPESPAAEAGLMDRDVVLEFDGLDVTQMLFDEIPFLKNVGVTSHFKVQRGEEILEFDVTRIARG